MKEIIYLAQPLGPTFPSIGQADPTEITYDRIHAYLILDEAGAEAERAKMASLYSDYNCAVHPVQQSNESGYIVVGHPSAQTKDEIERRKKKNEGEKLAAWEAVLDPRKELRLP
jgi:hypothetical protein